MKIQVHYLIGRTVNIDNFTCTTYESDIGAGVLRLTDGADVDGPVMAVQYRKPSRVIIRPDRRSDAVT